MLGPLQSPLGARARNPRPPCDTGPMVPEVRAAVTPRCAAHPDQDAGATCQRCGSFLCGACRHWVLSAVYCPTCAARPEINYLETFRLRFWGRRDAWTYLVGLVTLALVGAALKALVEGLWPVALALLGAAGVGVAFFLGQRWARIGLMLVPVAAALLAMPQAGAPVLAVCFIPFCAALQIYLDPRNRLFFRIDVPRNMLRRLWDLHANNPLARHALTLGISSVFMPVLAPLAVLFGLIALRRVDPNARPPIGRKGQALTGIVLGVGAVLLWGFFVLPLLLPGFGWLRGG